jgi:hypothetical protein
MNYINNKVSNRYRSELGNFIGNYKKWDYIVGLSYRDNIRNEKIGRRKIKNLFNNLSKYDKNINGVNVRKFNNYINKKRQNKTYLLDYSTVTAFAKFLG